MSPYSRTTSNAKPARFQHQLFRAPNSTFTISNGSAASNLPHYFDRSMNYILHNNLRLSARNEGKIKSYESCSDVRAWSHDVNAKDRYLREWIKRDMPISVIPISTLTGFLRTMTCKSHRRVAPRCHPDCKSKVLLDSICTSCHAMRQSLKDDDNFDKYFVEEELETSQWPCEGCLEALKSIKMFWKIIIDKIFNINISKYYEYDTDCNSGDSVRSIAKAWQSEMVQQAMYVKNINPVMGKVPMNTKKETSERNFKSWLAEDKYSKLIGTKQTRLEEVKEDTRGLRQRKKFSKGTNVATKVIDTACDTCFFEKDQDEIKVHKKNLQVLQEKCNGHIDEVERLKRENNSLRIELENVYKGCPWKATFYCPDSHHSLAPKPFEVALEDKCPDPAKNIDSEIVITMKKCKNENFKHVSLLQVLHKTNELSVVDDTTSGPCKKEDPIDILTKVQNTFGAIVKREMSINNDRRHRPKKQTSDIEATFHRINSSKSAPSCSTLSSRLSSELNFVSAKETSDKHNIK